MTNGKFNALIVDYVVFPWLILSICLDGPSRSHPYFISKEAYKELVEGTGVMNEVKAEDWATPFGLESRTPGGGFPSLGDTCVVSVTGIASKGSTERSSEDLWSTVW